VSTYEWFKLYSKGWLTGSIRAQLNPSERGVWTDLLALANESRQRGFIQRAEGIPYTREYIANLLEIPVELLNSTIDKCCADTNNSLDGNGTRLEVLDNGIIKIGNWERYQYIPADKGKMDAITKQKQDEVITRKMVCKRPDIAKDTLIELGKINDEAKKE